MPMSSTFADDPPGLALLDAGLLPMVAVAVLLLTTAFALFVLARRARVPAVPGPAPAEVDRRLAWPVPGAGVVVLGVILASMADNELFGLELVADRSSLPLVLGGVALLGFVGVWLLALAVSRADVR